MKRPILATILLCAALVGPVGSLEAQTFPSETVHVFGEDGQWPNTFYGTTSDFAGFGTVAPPQRGTIFQLDTSPDLFGLYTVHAFDGTDGANPFGGFTHVSDSNE